jgi:hypothetical protein
VPRKSAASNSLIRSCRYFRDVVRGGAAGGARGRTTDLPAGIGRGREHRLFSPLKGLGKAHHEAWGKGGEEPAAAPAATAAAAAARGRAWSESSATSEAGSAVVARKINFFSPDRPAGRGAAPPAERAAFSPPEFARAFQREWGGGAERAQEGGGAPGGAQSHSHRVFSPPSFVLAYSMAYGAAGCEGRGGGGGRRG